jgi:adenosylcobinamide-phosphate synthase
MELLDRFQFDNIWVTRLLIMLGGLTLDALIGDPRWIWRFLPHPVVWFGAVTTLLERVLNPPYAGPRTRFAAGLMTVFVVLAMAGALGAVVAALATYPKGWIAQLVLFAILVAQRDLFDHVRAVRKALIKGGVHAGREAVGKIVGRDTESLDHHAVARAAIETLAENFSDGVIAPSLFFLVLGPIGLCVYKAINTLDSMIGHRTARYRWFGKSAARIDDAANLVPARLSGIILCIAAILTPTANPFRAFVTMIRDAPKHRSPNSGWPEAAMAGAFDLALGGPRKYGHDLLREPWLGTGRARAIPSDIGRALWLFAMGCLVHALLLVIGIAAILAFSGDL